MRIDNAEFSGSLTGTEATAYLTGSFSGSFHGELIGSISSASFAHTASQLTAQNGTASVNGHLIPTDSGSHDLGSINNPFRDLFVTTASLNFVRNGKIVSVVNAGNEFIQVGNIIIGTSSISYASGSNGDIQNIITVDTSSVNNNMVTFESPDGEDSSYTGSFSGSFHGDGSNLTGIAGGESIASLNTFTSSIQSEVDALQLQTSSYLTSSGSVDFSDVTNKPTLHSGSQQVIDSLPANTVSGSGYISSSVVLNIITFTQADGTTEALTVHTGSGGGAGGESIAALSLFTSSIQSEVDALQLATGSYLTSSGSVDFTDITNTPSLHSGSQQVIDSLPANTVSGSGYISSSIDGQVITFNQADGTTETLTVPAGGGGGGESIAALSLFTSSIQSEVDALQAQTGSYLTSSGSVDFDDVTNVPANLVSSSGYISSSIDGSVITFLQSDGTTETVTVPAGGGGSTDVLEYNNVVRYTVTSGSNNAEIVCAGNVYKNISWSRTSTTLTVTNTSHGLSVGDVVHIRNMSENYVAHDITAVTTNTFDLTVANSGGTSGTEGVYTPVPRVSEIDGIGGSVIFNAPSVGDPQMQTAKIYFNVVENNEINIDVPAGIDDGFGTNSSLSTRFIPQVNWYKVDGSNPVLTNTATVNFTKLSNHARYTIGGGAVDTFGNAIAMLRF